MKTIYMEAKGEKGNLKVVFDDFAESPREWDNLGTMICFHRRYKLGDSHNYNPDNYDGWDELEMAVKKGHNAAIMIPLYMYDHSGITISISPFSCPWDSGQIGWIIATKEDIRKNFNMKRVSKKKIEETKGILLAEVDIYDKYLRGEVYGFIVEDKAGDLVDSCYGFFDVEDIKECLPSEYLELFKELEAV